MASLVLKMSVSLDGYVAPLDGSTDWIAAGRSDDGVSWTAEILSNAGAHAATCTRRPTPRSATGWTLYGTWPAGTRGHRGPAASSARAWLSVAPGDPGEDESAADDAPTTL
jgi:hypothetical protein